MFKSSTFAAGSAAVSAAVLMAVVCVWQELQPHHAGHSWHTQAGLETLHPSVPPLPRHCLAHSFSQRVLTSLRRKLSLFSSEIQV